MAARPQPHDVHRVISGGQTGVDRAALDAAIALGIEHGGCCPRGRLAEDGLIPEMYELWESESAEYPVRTERNVQDSDGTLILHYAELRGGTELTYRMAKKHGKPCLLVDLLAGSDTNDARRWLDENDIHVLNVAGPRESTAAGIGQRAQAFLSELLK